MEQSWDCQAAVWKVGRCETGLAESIGTGVTLRQAIRYHLLPPLSDLQSFTAYTHPNLCVRYHPTRYSMEMLHVNEGHTFKVSILFLKMHSPEDFLMYASFSEQEAMFCVKFHALELSLQPCRHSLYVMQQSTGRQHSTC
jgi:hypothetical protein